MCVALFVLPGTCVQSWSNGSTASCGLENITGTCSFGVDPMPAEASSPCKRAVDARLASASGVALSATRAKTLSRVAFDRGGGPRDGILFAGGPALLVNPSSRGEAPFAFVAAVAPSEREPLDLLCHGAVAAAGGGWSGFLFNCNIVDASFWNAWMVLCLPALLGKFVSWTLEFCETAVAAESS